LPRLRWRQGETPSAIIGDAMRKKPANEFVPQVLGNLTLFLLVATCGCASLPDTEKVAGQKLSNSDQPAMIVGRGGDLPPKASKAILKRLEGQVESTKLLQRQVEVMQAVSESSLVADNKVTLLIDGEATYAAMFEAIRNARDHINFESYIFEDDEVGRRFSDLLIQKRAEGVQVNLIYDSVGCLKTPTAFFQRLRDGGVVLLEFNPLNPSKVPKGRTWTLEHRDHRKILVIDGAIAFTGGLNISTVYSGSSHIRSHREKKHETWRDTHVRIEGPAAAELQKLFMNTWERQKGVALPARNYFPDVKSAGKTLVRVVGNLPGETNRITYMMYMSAIMHAENSIHLTTSYFVPDKQMITALNKAAARGVDVKILLPGYSDSSLAGHASRSYYTRFLKAGVHVYERRGGMLHAKTGVVDGVWATVGSTNLDPQSLLKNDEVNAVILGRDFADLMEAMFETDLKEADQIHLEKWKKRSLGNRLKEWWSRLFSHWL
jgi:cardiolipin synthase